MYNERKSPFKAQSPMLQFEENLGYRYLVLDARWKMGGSYMQHLVVLGEDVG